MRHRFHALAASAALVAVVTSRPAVAAGPAVVVLELATEDVDDQAKALTKALKARLRAMPDRTVADADLSLSVLSLSLKCGDVPDATCQGKIADKIKAETYVWGTLRKQGATDVLADVRLFQRGQPEVRQQVTFPQNLKDQNDPALQRVADQILQRLFNPGKVGTARIVAKAAMPGELYVDGKAAGAFKEGALELTLPVGDHHFEVRNGTKVLGAADGKVMPTGTVEVSLLTPAEGAPPPPSTGGAFTADSDHPPKNWKRTAGYVGVGAGAVLIGAGVYSMLKVSSINNDEGFSNYRKGFRSSDDVCDKADQGVVSPAPGAASPGDVASKCSSGKSFQTLQYVFLGVGAVSAGVGAYFLMSSKKEAARRVVVVPTVAKGHQGVDLAVRF